MSADSGPAKGAELSRGSTANRDLALTKVHEVTVWSGVGALAVTAFLTVGLAPGSVQASPGTGQVQAQFDNGSDSDTSNGGGFGAATGGGAVASSGAS